MREIDTGTDDLIAGIEDGVAVLTLNRPDRRNALLSLLGEGLCRFAVVVRGARVEMVGGLEVEDLLERGGE